ncbi:MAG: type II toxin-antitoxin system Phd/YefM family antitoxin [Candidatus Riflebacteria bacterium]|nr:type II toxin-antitoxin system Phd/YefM family antitoxin [Candidatus Riflebacteria bacterium]
MSKVTTSTARKDFSTLVNRAAFGKERVVLTRRGKTLAAIVPVEDLERLEELEDQLDVEKARRRIADAKARGEEPIPWDEAKKRLGR